MTSTSNAMSGGPLGGISWQVDIPSLSQLVVSVGSHGLKQLALSGVDIHSISCMLMIAEYTLTSEGYSTEQDPSKEQNTCGSIKWWR